MTSGVFGLLKVYKKQVQNVTDNNFESWPESATYGYYGGGFSSPPATYLNTITRLDFSNETISNPGNNLPTGRSGFEGTSNNFYGYFGGGLIPTYISTITRLDLSNETVSDPGNNLPTARSSMGVTSSDSYGYFGGGDTPTSISTITRLDLSNETVSDPGNNLPTARTLLGSLSSNSYGYYGGGTGLSIISRLDFSNETVSNPGNNLPTERSNLKGTSNNSYGYFGGGYSPPGSPPIATTITRLDFSNETVSDPGNNFPTTRSGLSATSSDSYGYFGGGYSPPFINTISRLDFSNETVSDPGNNLPTARSGLSAVSGGTSFYRAKGFKTYGYFAGGLRPSIPGNSSTVTRLDFSTELLSSPAKNLTSPRYKSNTVTNNNYSYFGGNSPATNTITRLDFSNETSSNPGKNLSLSLNPGGSTESCNYGYFFGGSPTSPPFTSSNTVMRLDFSNETSSNPGKNTPSAAIGGSGVSTKLYGYIGRDNGLFLPSQQLKINFSTEVISLTGFWSPRGKDSASTVQNNLYGYFCGGSNGPPGPLAYNTISRLDFSSETFSNPGNNLPTTTSISSASSSSFYGYINPGLATQMSRIDFSTDNLNLTTNFTETILEASGFSN
jgi:hypothetical protein